MTTEDTPRPTPWLSDAEVIQLTGYMQPTRQARWLSENGIRCYVNGLGQVRVPRETFTGSDTAKKRRTEPDFSKVRRIGS